MYYTKKHYPFHGLFLLFAGLSLLGCTDEDDNYASVHPGNAIQFSVERIATRTHYEDKYEENGSSFYPIDWDAGDRIFISSADAYPGASISDQRHAIYSVAPADDASYHGSITAINPTSGSVDGAYGLHWETGENFNKPYTFYGAYPAQRVKGYSNSMDDMTSGTLTMQYYTNQVCKITSVENGQYESEPDMMNAYVVSSEGCKGASDGLHFTPEGYRELGRHYAMTVLKNVYRMLPGMPDSPAESLTMEETDMEIQIGTGIELNLTADFGDGYAENVASLASYELSNPEVARISNGKIVGLAQGKTDVKATYTDPTGQTLTATFTLQATYFPFGAEFIHTNLFGEGTYVEDKRAFFPSQYGQMGWVYSSGIDMSV